MSEQLSVRKGAGYNDVIQSGHNLEEGLSWSSKREASAHSPDEEVESCNVEEGEEEEGEDEDRGDERGEEGEDDGDGVTLTREPLKVEVQEALEMGTPVHSSFLKCGPLMTLTQR